jgi:HD-GYP domain-containing protein (c-di-GMP phosphodiesterase class II)
MEKTEYIAVRPSQVHLIEKTPFYYRTKESAFNLYKESGRRLDKERIEKEKFPDLYIAAKDKDGAMKELASALNMELAAGIASKGLAEVKNALCRIVEEALTPHQVKMLDALPETVEILVEGYSKDPKAVEYLIRMAGNSPLIIEHTVNVMALILQYCFFHRLEENKIKQLLLCGLLHDVGTSRIDKSILEARRKLTDQEFKTYAGHSVLGHDLIITETDFDVSVATVALEHHERIDGSGYPHGTAKITADSRLIGIIDCYEPLTYRDKNFRKAKKPYDSLSLIKEEVKAGRFDKETFKNFTSCLIK